MLDDPDYIQQDQRADYRGDQQAQNARARDVELTEQPDSYKGTRHSHDQVSQQAESFSLPDATGQKSRQDPNRQKDQQVFRTHDVFSFFNV
jgi:hypothetical protein